MLEKVEQGVSHQDVCSNERGSPINGRHCWSAWTSVTSSIRFAGVQVDGTHFLMKYCLNCGEKVYA